MTAECQELLSRAELAREARAQGLRVTERTLRFWASRGLLPPPQIVKRRACYPRSILGSLHRIEALRPRTIQEIKELVWDSDRFHCTMYTEGNTVVVRFRPKKSKES